MEEQIKLLDGRIVLKEEIPLMAGGDALVIDNLISPQLQNHIQHICDNKIMFLYNAQTSEGDKEVGDKVKDTFQYVGQVVANSKVPEPWGNALQSNFNFGTSLFLPLDLSLAGINESGFNLRNLIRCKVNRTHFTPDFKEDNYHIPHVDGNRDKVNDFNTSVIYHVNESDGDILFFKNHSDDKNWEVDKTVSWKKGRIIIFPAHVFHAGKSPMKHKERTLINYNYKI